MPARPAVSRRAVLAAGAAGSAALLVPATGARPAAAATQPVLPFVDHYTTNVVTNLTPQTNAAVRVLSGVQRLWRTGETWDGGQVLDRAVLEANVRHVARATRTRTDEQARTAFVHDRQHQSYAVIAGLGPLAGLYRDGALAVTGITSAPEGTPPQKVTDELPADAPPGSALGAGSETSELGAVVRLVNTVRGPYASGNPAKLAYQYPRPWRMRVDGSVVPTGATDEFGFPVYDSPVVVAAQLLRQRGEDPAQDGGYPSGHTNAFHLAALAMAHAVPERFQELVTRAFELSDSRIVAGMHSPVDVIGGRVLATALAAAALHDPANAPLKQQARAQAAAFFQERTGTDATGLLAAAHPGSGDAYADRAANRAAVLDRLTYGFPRRGAQEPMEVPEGAEVLLETRLPYLDAGQRREVLRTTALPAGYPLLDGPESWGRLNLFDAADGYGRLDARVEVVMDAAAGGFCAADTWRNDIAGRGGLLKRGSGRLTLTGDNSWRGGTRVAGGVLVAASRTALGDGDVTVTAGALQVAAVPGGVRLRDDLTVAAQAVLRVPVGAGGTAPLRVDGTARLDAGATLEIDLTGADDWRPGRLRPLLRAGRLRAAVSEVSVVGGAARVELVRTREGLSARLVSRG